MIRVQTTPRPNFGKRLEVIGLTFWAWDDYWKEDVCYKFTSDQIDLIEEVTYELHQMCIQAVDHVIKHNLLSRLGIPEIYHDAIRNSFARRDKDISLYGRFDLAYDGITLPKMLEYNADTPTSILESAVAQWYWLEDKNELDKTTNDQFNSLHEKLVDRWKMISHDLIHFSITPESEEGAYEEDCVAIAYLMETAIQAGKKVSSIGVDQIGWDEQNKQFVDLQNNPIDCLFKLYPWEWMMREDFGPKVLESKTQFIEPIWKSVLSTKGILPILWELFPGHPYLLEAHFDDPCGMTEYAKKPLYSREGANITLVTGDGTIHGNDHSYGEEGFIYQRLFHTPAFQGKYPVIGSWVVGDEPAGMCIREDNVAITTNMSNFVPHFFN